MRFVSIENESLRVVADANGAALHSIYASDAEYLWQGDPFYWSRRDSNLFPYVGRLTDGKYQYEGNTYGFPIHGFCIGREFAITAAETNRMRFSLYSNEETLAMYPFLFAFHVEYALEKNTIRKTFIVENTGKKTMYFGLGGHPGFHVPIHGDGCFEDWYLEFSEPSLPCRVGLHPETFLLNDADAPFVLDDGLRIPLRHDLFDRGAIILKDVPKEISIRSRRSTRAVTVSYPQMSYVVLWHKPESDAPYVCIEPWSSLPSHHGRVEDLALQPSLIHLKPGETYENMIRITIDT